MKKQANRLILTVCAAIILSISVQAAPKMLVPGGSVVGISLDTKGVVVTGFEEGSAAKAAGIKKGDLILAVDGEQIHTASALKERLKKGNMVLTVLREGRETEFCVQPKTGRIGAYVRDHMAGIGTLTYYDPETGGFGALGHGVNDGGSAVLIPMEDGTLVETALMEVKKGKSGTPGELKGKLDLGNQLGSVERNCPYGIFGTMTCPSDADAIPMAASDEIKTGKATILSTVSDEGMREYDVQILRLYPHADDTGRNLLLKVTDEELLDATGGIVQGMSGSPIIQDGKLVGAVTHVLVNDPTRGYGIFIENMSEAAE